MLAKFNRAVAGVGFEVQLVVAVVSEDPAKVLDGLSFPNAAF